MKIYQYWFTEPAGIITEERTRELIAGNYKDVDLAFEDLKKHKTLRLPHSTLVLDLYSPELWCSCEAPDREYDVPDGFADNGDRLYKHHWNCGNCHGIVQVG